MQLQQTLAGVDLLVPEIPYLRRYARALTRNAANGDDLVQNALVRAVSNMQKFEAGTNLRAWLLTIVHNCFIDEVRKNKRSRDNDALAESRMSGLYTRPNQESAIQMNELRAALDTLPEPQRQTIILIALEDFSYEEAAKLMNVPIGTVRSRLSRARYALMEQLEGLTIAEISPEKRVTRRKRSSEESSLKKRHAPGDRHYAIA